MSPSAIRNRFSHNNIIELSPHRFSYPHASLRSFDSVGQSSSGKSIVLRSSIVPLGKTQGDIVQFVMTIRQDTKPWRNVADLMTLECGGHGRGVPLVTFQYTPPFVEESYVNVWEADRRTLRMCRGGIQTQPSPRDGTRGDVEATLWAAGWGACFAPIIAAAASRHTCTCTRCRRARGRILIIAVDDARGTFGALLTGCTGNKQQRE